MTQTFRKLAILLVSGFVLGAGWTLPARAAADDVAAHMAAAEQAYRAGDLALAKQRFEALARRGVMEAQYQIGILLSGSLDEADRGRSVLWLTNASAQGHKKAFALLQTFAALGEADAIYAVGMIYLTGGAVPEDGIKALEHFMESAALDYGPAMNEIGLMYRDGRIVPQDYEQARRWFEGAAQNGSGIAVTNLGGLYFEGLGVEADPELAFGLYLTAAKLDEPRAQLLVGAAFFKGDIFKQDIVESAYWLARAEINQSERAAEFLPLVIEQMTEDQREEVARRLEADAASGR